MEILFFNRSFYPDTEATGQFLTELCEDLTKSGCNITVICGKSYHVHVERKSFFIQKEKYKSMDIIRARGTTLPKNFLIFRLINLSFYFIFAFIGGFLVKKKPEIVITQTDPPVSGLLGIFFAKWYKAKFIYSCKDIYPEVGVITGRLTNPILNFLLKKINLLSFKSADKIICLGEDMKRRIASKDIDENKIFVIHDWADTASIYPIPESENPFILEYCLQNYFTVMYSGNIGFTQGLDRVIDVADYFKKNKKIKFLLVGEGADKINLQKLVNEQGLTNTIFLPYQPKEKLKFSLSAPNLHLITFVKGLAGVMVPSKIYGILAAGKPFIAWIDKESEIYTITEKFKCGIAVSPGDVQGMISAIEWSINNNEKLIQMGQNARQAALDFFDRKISVAKYKKIFQEI